ncbi:MAG: HAMP domain-containing histidine kinase [Phycisphaerales bacterium]|nr:HAMP domain-containing histidine kinase [Phycisphaerales bacterium]
MSLRAKCALLLLAFEVTLGVTIFLTVRYIHVYFDDASQSLTASSVGFSDIGRLQTLTRDERTSLQQFDPSASARLEQLQRDIARTSATLCNVLSDKLDDDAAKSLTQHVQARQVSVDAFLAGAHLSDASRPFDSESHLSLEGFLGRLESKLQDDVRALADESFKALERSTLILSVNMVVGAALGVLGMLLVRRWVLLPIQELKESTDALGKGNLNHKARVASHDELGQLAAAFNRMSSDLARIEEQMIKRERQAAMGELISYVAHNIRNPLAGIQSSADACRRRLEPDSPLRVHHDEIVYAIDRFQRWLRELERTCSPLELNARPTDIHEIIDNVVTVFRPMSERRCITVQRGEPNGLRTVKIDDRHFEQALAAIVGNAIEAAGDHGRVTIEAHAGDDASHWSLSVADTGPGIPPSVRSQIFEPAYSTKKSGHGLGLALARKIVELHGGRITVDCSPEGGTVFRCLIPLEPNAGLTHG